MGRSQRVRQEDVRALMRMMGELHELPPDPETIGRHLMTRICELVDGRMALVGVIRPVGAAGNPEIVSCVVGGWFDDQARSVYERYVDGECAADPTLAALKNLVGQTVVRTREELMCDREWYRNPHVAEVRREADLDGYLTGVYPLAERGLLASFAVSRPWGAARFGMRERTLLSLLNSELGWFYRQLHRGLDGNAISRLPPRLKQTLDALTIGLSEKQAARKLRLSRHTVHDYVKELHRRFDVSSRGELLAAAHRQTTHENHDLSATTDKSND